MASESSVISAALILNEGEEKKVKAEDIVLVTNRNGNKVLAVCRGGLGSNENLRTGAYSPGVAYARMGRHPSNAKEFYAFSMSIIGDVTAKLEQNKYVIAPSSQVEIFEEADNPMKLLGRGDKTIGYYKDTRSWKVPYNPDYVPYHLGVFGVTGSGKSFLARYQLVPILQESGLDVIVFDWKGSDYAPYYKSILKLNDVYLDDEVVFAYLLDQMDYFGMTGERKYKNDAAEALEEVISDGQWREQPTAQVRTFLELHVVPIIEANNTDQRGNVSRWGQMYVRKFRRAIRKLKDKDFENIRGQKKHEDILKIARDNHVLVMDLSEGSKQEKLAIFLSFARYLKGLMEKKERVNLALLINEGPQYCPWEPRGIQAETTETITELCAVGTHCEAFSSATLPRYSRGDWHQRSCQAKPEHSVHRQNPPA